MRRANHPNEYGNSITITDLIIVAILGFLLIYNTLFNAHSNNDTDVFENNNRRSPHNFVGAFIILLLSFFLRIYCEPPPVERHHEARRNVEARNVRLNRREPLRDNQTEIRSLLRNYRQYINLMRAAFAIASPDILNAQAEFYNSGVNHPQYQREEALSKIISEDLVPSEYVDTLSAHIMDEPVQIGDQICDRSFMERLLAIKPENPFNRQTMRQKDLVTNTDLLNKMNLFTAMVLQNADHVWVLSLSNKKKFISEIHRIVNTVVEHTFLHGSLTRAVCFTHLKKSESKIKIFELMMEVFYLFLTLKDDGLTDQFNQKNKVDLDVLLKYMLNVINCFTNAKLTPDPRLNNLINRIVFRGDSVRIDDQEQGSSNPTHFLTLE